MEKLRTNVCFASSYHHPPSFCRAIRLEKSAAQIETLTFRSARRARFFALPERDRAKMAISITSQR